MTALAELLVTTPEGTTTCYELGEHTVIGRQPECQIVLTDPLASRRHSLIDRRPDGRYFVEDNKSANGTLLNGQVLRSRSQLRDGDSIQIGSTVLVLRINAPESVCKSAWDPSLSVIRIEDEVDRVRSIEFAQRADAKVVSDEEATSLDVWKLKQVSDRLKLLVDLSKEMGASLDEDRLLTMCLDKLFGVFPQADRGLVVLYGPDGSLPANLSPEKHHESHLDRRTGALTRVKFRTPETYDSEIRVSRTVLQRVRSQRQVVLVSDALNDAAAMSMLRLEIKSLMCAPLIVSGEDLGFIQLETRRPEFGFGPDDVGVLTAVAGQVAVVIRNADLARDAAAAAAQRENLSRFLSPQLVDRVLSGHLSVTLGGTEKKGTVFFSDIVGFTKLAPRLGAQSVMLLLNRYFTVMQEIIFRRGGAIDKCQGDSIMAHWGVIGDIPDSTANAVAASIEMQNALFSFNRDEVMREGTQLTATPLAHGIGLNTGIVCAGNIGSERKIEFTVIGEAVNLSSRIESLAGRFQVFVGEPTYFEIKSRAFCVRMPEWSAKNVEHAPAVFSVRGIVPPPLGNTNPTVGGRSEFQIQNLLLCLPCNLTGQGFRLAGIVVRLVPDGAGGGRLWLQMEHNPPIGSMLTLDWDIPEKVFPVLKGEIDGLGSPRAARRRSMISASPAFDFLADTQTLLPGTVSLRVAVLPPELAEWRPGLLLQSDLRSAQEMVRK